MYADLGPGQTIKLESLSPNTVELLYSHQYVARRMQQDNEQDVTSILEKVNLYAYCVNNPINFVDPYGLSVINDANRRRGHGPWADSAQHCWAACYFGVVYGLGNVAAIVGDIGEVLAPSSDWWRDIKAQHYGAALGNTYSWVYVIGCAKHTPSDYCDAACDTWP